MNPRTATRHLSPWPVISTAVSVGAVVVPLIVLWTSGFFTLRLDLAVLSNEVAHLKVEVSKLQLIRAIENRDTLDILHQRYDERDADNLLDDFGLDVATTAQMIELKSIMSTLANDTNPDAGLRSLAQRAVRMIETRLSENAEQE